MPLFRLFAAALPLTACAVSGVPGSDGKDGADGIPQVLASVESDPVASRDDAADDPAIWVHPTDPAKSLVLGTDKKAGLNVYDMTGALVAMVDIPRPNNVDIRGDLAVTGNRGDNTISLLRVSAAGVIEIGRSETTRPEPYGICLGLVPIAGQPAPLPVAAVTHKSGKVDLYAIQLDQPARAFAVTGFDLKTQLEGCVFDEQNKVLFVGREEVGIMAARFADIFDDSLALGTKEVMVVDLVDGESGITADVEGLTLYRTGETSGYVIASSQGNNSFAVYDRETFAFLGRFGVADGPQVDGVAETDGIDASSANLGPGFENGALIVQDGFNDPEKRQNFKYIPWAAVEAALGL